MLVTLKIIKNKILLNLLRILIILSILIITLEIADASNATIAYRSASGSGVNNPKVRLWDNSTSDFGSETELAAAGNPNSPVRYAIIKQSPISSKMIIVTQSDNGNITAYITNNGTNGAGSWTQTLLGTVWLTAPSVSSRRFDVAFETTSGDALIVYAVQSTDGARDLAYRRVRARDLNISYGQEQYIDDTDQATDVVYTWTNVARDPNKSSDDIVLVSLDSTNSDTKAWGWNGTNWTAETEISAATTETAGFEAQIAEYAEDGSKGMVCTATGLTGSVNCQYYNQTRVFFATNSPDMGTGTGDVRFLEAKGDPNTDDIMMLSIESGSDLLTSYWNGATWSAVTTHDSTVDNITARIAGFFWNATGSTGRLVWDTDTTGATVNVSIWTGSWTSQVPFVQRQYMGTGQWMTWYRNPTTLDRINAIGIRLNATTFNLKWINWTGVNPIMSSNGTVYTISTNVGSGLFESYNLAFQSNNTNPTDSAPTVLLEDPANNNVSETGDITFIANASDDWDLINATLYTNLTGSWTANESILININDISVTLNGKGDTLNRSFYSINDIPTGTVFIWNVQYCDDRNQCSFASSNRTVNVSIPAAGNTAPTISAIFPLNASGSITESGVSNFSFSFNATDVDGADTLNDTSSRINLTSPSGDQVRLNNTCGQYGANLNTTTVNYTCVVPIYYFDEAGNWSIIASIADNSAVMAENKTGANLTLFTTLAIVIGPAELTFSSIRAGAVNTTSDNDPIYVNNTGNQNITVNNVRITPITLAGATQTGFNLSAANFSVSNQTAAFNPECNTTTPELANNTVYNIIETILPRGNNSAGTGPGNGVEQVYVCLRATPGASVLPAQTYSATGGAAWTISVI